MGNLDRMAYDAEIRNLVAFYSQATVIAGHVIASTITTLVAANRGVHFLVLSIPRELMNLPANPPDVKLLGPPACSKDYETDVRVHCIREWTYVVHLLQYWNDAGSVYTYRCPMWQESKLMLYVFYRINAMLNPYGIVIQLHEVMDNTLWLSYYQAYTQPEQCKTDYESHLHVIKGLEILQNWLRNCTFSVKPLQSGDISNCTVVLWTDCLSCTPMKTSDPAMRAHSTCSRGICPNEVEPTLENAPRVANAMLKALVRHNRRQSKARDYQEYQQQQDNT